MSHQVVVVLGAGGISVAIAPTRNQMNVRVSALLEKLIDKKRIELSGAAPAHGN